MFSIVKCSRKRGNVDDVRDFVVLGIELLKSNYLSKRLQGHFSFFQEASVLSLTLVNVNVN